MIVNAKSSTGTQSIYTLSLEVKHSGERKNIVCTRGNGMKIAHINSQSLSHFLLINNAASSTQPVFLPVFNGIHFH